MTLQDQHPAKTLAFWASEQSHLANAEATRLADAVDEALQAKDSEHARRLAQYSAESWGKYLAYEAARLEATTLLARHNLNKKFAQEAHNP